MTEIAKGIIPIKTIEAGGETAQYVWNTTTDTGAGAGLHITQIPEDDFLADPDSGGMNTLIQSEAQIFRNGLTPRAVYGLDGTTLLTPEGAEAFRVSASSGATSTETFKVYVNEYIPVNNTLTYEAPVLDGVTSGETITVSITTFALSSSTDELEFSKGTSATKTITVSTSTTSVYYDGAHTFRITAGSLMDLFNWFSYTETTPTPEISIKGKILTNGFVYAESRFVAWENNSPTSNFSAQTISLNGYEGEYDAVEIYYSHSTSDARRYCIKGEVGNTLPLNVQGQQYNRTGGRTADINANNVIFSAAYYNTNANNSYAIPTKIVGIKYI